MNKSILFTAVAVGFTASIAFILIQPLFGMSTLTSRHALAYVTQGGYTQESAMIIAWCVHISVSIGYALLSSIIMTISQRYWVSLGQIIVLGWLTTLIATPANEWVVKWVNSGKFTALSDLAHVNTHLDAKFWLHIVFFVFIVLQLTLYTRKR